MGDEVTKRDLQLVQSSIALLKKDVASVKSLVDDVVKALAARIKALEDGQGNVYAAILAGDKVAEKLVAPVRDSVAALEKRVQALE